MSRIVQLSSGMELSIESPLEAPQYPLDCGWWRLVVSKAGEVEEFIGELQTKDARGKIYFINSWIESLVGFPQVGHPQRNLYTSSTWRAAIESAINQA